ncbi:hypothetical protein BKA66DRAFT_573112 [Pyrenochaeta sp. MPI-SDFR-AT-0127]|nr:hypothetical protein BKA66DRAFT_573112 [Pyrenochaeta sp. MPI-SDFR-AT-0127]
MKPPAVIVTEIYYVTVTPNPVVSIPTSLALSKSLSSDTIDMSSITRLSSTPTPMSNSHGSSSTTLHSPSSMPTLYTSLPPLPSQFATPIKPKAKFNDTFAIIVLVAVIILGLVLFGMIGYMIYLRQKGQCPKCKSMEEQLAKWERGDLKRITKDMIRKREALNQGLSGPNSAPEVDIEMGAIVKDTVSTHNKASFWGKAKEAMWNAKGKSMRNETQDVKGTEADVPPLNRIREPSVYGDRYFTMQIDSANSIRETSPQAPHAYFKPGENRVYEPSSSSAYSQPTGFSEGIRAFRDHTVSNMPQPGHPYQESILQPTRYAESEPCRALRVINGADHEVQRARHPSICAEPLDPNTFDDVNIKNGGDAVSPASSYQPVAWRTGPHTRPDGFF